MKALICVSCMMLLSGCISFGRDGDIAEAPMAKDATGQMLTALPVQQVATCIAAAYQTTPQTIEGGYAVPATGRGASYRVLAFADPLDRYMTRVDIIGEPSNPNGAGQCLA